MQLSPLGPRDCRKKLRFMKLKSLVERPLEGKTWTSEEEEGQVSSELRVEASAAVLGFLGRIWRGWFCRFWTKLQYEFSYCSCYWSNWHYWDIEAVLLGVLPAGSRRKELVLPPLSCSFPPGSLWQNINVVCRSQPSLTQQSAGKWVWRLEAGA